MLRTVYADHWQPTLYVANAEPVPLYLPHDVSFCVGQPDWGGGCDTLARLEGSKAVNKLVSSRIDFLPEVVLLLGDFTLSHPHVLNLLQEHPDAD
eukprot:COSAG06_NODE_38176_length_426_cov_1.100917_2_plen_94_part_01